MAEKAKEKAEKKPKKVEAAAPAKKPKKSAAKRARVKVRACKVDGCKQKYRAKGYCRKHYKKWRHGAYGKTRYRSCMENECHRPMVVNRHGYCEDHYIQHFVKKIPSAAPPVEENAAQADAG